MSGQSNKRKTNKRANPPNPIRAQEWISALAAINPEFEKLAPLIKLIERDYSGVKVGGVDISATMPMSGISATVNKMKPGDTAGQMLEIDKMSEQELLNLKKFTARLMDDVDKRLEEISSKEKGNSEDDS